MITLAVSQCLMGDNVRYDGKTKTHDYVLHTLATVCNIKTICPEVEIGMPVPRAPIQLVYSENRIHVQEVGDASKDYTDKLRLHARDTIAQLTDISGYVFKARSPSCGVKSTPVLSLAETQSGIFSNETMMARPFLPVIDEAILDDVNYRDQFLENVFCFAAFQRDEAHFIHQHGLRWALRTGKRVTELLKTPQSELESVFFEGMNYLLSLDERKVRLFEALECNADIIFGSDMEKNGRQWLKNTRLTKDNDAFFVQLLKIAEIINKNHKLDFSLSISNSEYELRRLKNS